MAGSLNLKEKWNDEIYCIGLDDFVEGGEDGVSNRGIKQVAENALFLKGKIESEAAAREQADADTLASAGKQTQNALSSHNTSEVAHADIRAIINNFAGLPAWDADNHILTFKDRSGATVIVDIPLEALVQDINYDPETKEIIFTRKDETEMRIDVSDLISVYTGSNGTHIQITVSEGNVIEAVLKAGTISETELEAALVEKIDSKQAALSTVQINNIAAVPNKLDTSTFNTHNTDTTKHITSTERTSWSGKQAALSTAQINNIAAVPDKLDAETFNTHNNDNTRHITATERTNWSGKQAALSTAQINNIAAVPNKLDTSTFNTHNTDTTKHITSTERNKWNAAPSANIILSAATGTGTDATTPAVASDTIQNIVQTIWNKIRQVVNYFNAKVWTTGNIADNAVTNVKVAGIDGSKITSGTIPIARIGTGTKSSTTSLRGDGTFATVPFSSTGTTTVSVSLGSSLTKGYWYGNIGTTGSCSGSYTGLNYSDLILVSTKAIRGYNYRSPLLFG